MNLQAVTWEEAKRAFVEFCERIGMDSNDSELRHAFMAGVTFAEKRLGIEEAA